MGSVVVMHGLSCFMACEVFFTRDQIGVLYIGSWIVNHWATKEAQSLLFGM